MVQSSPHTILGLSDQSTHQHTKQKNLVSRLLDQMKPNPTPGHGSRKKQEEQFEEVRFSATQLLQTCYGSRGLFPSSGAFACSKGLLLSWEFLISILKKLMVLLISLISFLLLVFSFLLFGLVF